MHSNNLRGFLALLLTLLLAAPVVQAKNKKAEKYYKDALNAEAEKKWDDALDLFEKAAAIDPTDVRYMIGTRESRFQAGAEHVKKGQKLRADGQLEPAITEFQLAIQKDPSSAIALQEWKRTSEMLEEEKKTGKTGGPDRGLTPAEKAQKEEQKRLDSMLPPPELKPITRLISTLKMNNQPPKVLYDTVGKLAGINVVFDQQYQSQGKQYNIDLSNTTLEQALDYLAVLTKTFWKPISANTIFVTEDNVTKRRDYEDNVVKVFYIKNATSTQEFQEIATAVRSLVEIRRVFTYNAQKAIVMRGTVDQIALAEKVVNDLDKPKGEVVVDVIVMEANSSRTMDLALAIQSGGNPGLNVPVQFTPRSILGVPITGNGGNNGNNGGSGGSGGSGSGGSGSGGSGSGGSGSGGSGSGGSNLVYVPLSNLQHLSTSDWSTTLPGALLNLLVSDAKTRILQRPTVRASDGQKVTLRIGDKIPYATGSFQPGFGAVGTGISPLVSTQFNFAEVGVNVDMTPQIHGTDEVTLKMAVEVSTVKSTVNIGGLQQPIIGQRKTETELRMKEGEVNILGGLAQDQYTKTLAGIPGLVDIPALGDLMGASHTDKEIGKLLIAVVPHIVRTPGYTQENLKGVYAGTDQVPHVMYAPKSEPETIAPGSEKVAPVQPAAKPATPAPSGLPRLSFAPPSVQGAVGTQVTLTLQADNVSDLSAAAPIRLKYDPRVLRLNDITPGNLLSGDGQQVTIAKDIRNDTGEATVTISRVAGTAGVNGSGALATFSFSAVGRGNGGVLLTEFGLKNSQNEPITIAPAPVTVTIQ
jgi:general secretion pathway protein D